MASVRYLLQCALSKYSNKAHCRRRFYDALEVIPKAHEIGIRKPKVEQLKKIADGLEISAIEFLDIEIENEADLIAMLKKISPFFKWDGLLHVLEGEKFL